MKNGLLYTKRYFRVMRIRTYISSAIVVLSSGAFLYTSAENSSFEKNVQTGVGIAAGCAIVGSLAMWIGGNAAENNQFEKYKEAGSAVELSDAKQKMKNAQTLSATGAWLNLASGALLGASFIWRRRINRKNNLSFNVAPSSLQVSIRF